MTTPIAILGATGYTALELFRILARHPHARATCATSRFDAGKPVCAVHPSLRGRIDLAFSNPDFGEIASRAEVAFLCLPHAASAEAAMALLERGMKVVDLSADYRLGDGATYRQWYGHDHPDAARLGTVPYGLPELFRDSIRGATLVANPGCYPTASTLALAPLLRAGLIAGPMIIDAKSGVSGAGRTPGMTTHFTEANEGLSPYKTGAHRHGPEIDRALSMACQRQTHVLFSPHLVPMDRGICATCYAPRARALTTADALNCLREAYAGEPFIRVVDDLPSTKHTLGTNFCDVTARVIDDTVVAIGCLDNLVKGASGQAVQNLNLVMGWDETAGLMA
ncbi:MAG: N-acetyl-gamma-glutamyl-phosphate reductase [Phycisphaeraceae bacterium]|nr:N-acetyl-gamma-glutamyl-phosphate reductase [Phycisphaeraceae bacterium]